mmetsp:Transcript_36001/g.78623  ORF Transcript_36001/g.78623 Transcript_36001/m.78623 type:complete len:295 (-) Transcript_36001:121-1005(-)
MLTPRKLKCRKTTRLGQRHQASIATSSIISRLFLLLVLLRGFFPLGCLSSRRSCCCALALLLSGGILLLLQLFEGLLSGLLVYGSVLLSGGRGLLSCLWRWGRVAVRRPVGLRGRCAFGGLVLLLFLLLGTGAGLGLLCGSQPQLGEHRVNVLILHLLLLVLGLRRGLLRRGLSGRFLHSLLFFFLLLLALFGLSVGGGILLEKVIILFFAVRNVGPISALDVVSLQLFRAQRLPLLFLLTPPLSLLLLCQLGKHHGVEILLSVTMGPISSDWGPLLYVYDPRYRGDFLPSRTY